MHKEHSFNWNLKDLTDTEIHSAIRYLDPDREERDVSDKRFKLAVRVVTLTIAALALILSYVWSH